MAAVNPDYFGQDTNVQLRGFPLATAWPPSSFNSTVTVTMPYAAPAPATGWRKLVRAAADFLYRVSG